MLCHDMLWLVAVVICSRAGSPMQTGSGFKEDETLDLPQQAAAFSGILQEIEV